MAIAGTSIQGKSGDTLFGISLTPWDRKQNIWKPWDKYEQYDPNAPRNSLGVRLDAERYAADTQAALTRDQWNTYVANFMPVEDNLIKYAQNQALPAENAERAIAGVGQAFEQQQGISQRRMKAYGIQATPEQTAAIDRSTKLNKSLAEVQAGNTARDMTLQRQRSIMGGAPQGGIL